jgi:hypothetical protein
VPPYLRDTDPGGYNHWIGGCYLITGVTDDAQDSITVPLASQSAIEGVRSRLRPDAVAGGALCITLQGRLFRLAAAGSLTDVAAEELPAALEALEAPSEIVLEAAIPAGCGEDHIAAVHLTL